MKKLAWLALGLIGLVSSASELTFKNHGKLIKTISLDELQKISPAREIKVYEPNEKVELSYRAMAFVPILDAIYGKAWKKTEELLFTCTDGYQPSVPSERFRKFTSFLAFERVGSKQFSLVNKMHNGEPVDLGPFYLIWDNLGQPELRATGGEGWPYQLTTVDLIGFAERFPYMAPPAGASEAGKRGFSSFRQHCLSCHSINGEGGARGVELNYPSSVTEYWKEDWLRKWIADPVSLRHGTTMPSFNQTDPKWKTDLEDILAYLKIMAKNKRKPK